MTTAIQDRRQRTIASALWAAFGDAIGFTTELADSALVKRRTGVRGPVSTTIPWQRLIGGKFGTLVDLPAGTYSDDTQLRLATSRCIRHDGHFDVESLAKIELPVWLNYSLGSGLGSKAAATSLCSSTATWYSNFFRSEKATYVHGGGNGAAMRVQPHIWCAIDLVDYYTYLPDVVRNAVVTHGHVRGIAGAVLHAVGLAFVFREGELPPPEIWPKFAEAIELLPELVDRDGDLKTFWLPTWEAESKISFGQAARAVAHEWVDICGVAARQELNSGRDYERVVEELGGLRPEERGSGLKAALFSLCAVWAMRSLAPSEVLQIVANLLSSDTDTIATMSGAILGALPNQPAPPGELQDRPLIEADAVRLHDISRRSASEDFNYPDLLYWQPPKSSLDAIGRFGDGYAIQGLGVVHPVGQVFLTRQGDTRYQWFRLESGQTLLCKRRAEPRPMPATSLPQPRKVASQQARLEGETHPREHDLFGHQPTSPQQAEKARKPDLLTLDSATDEAIHSNFNANVVGKNLLKFAEAEDGLELAVAFAAIVVKARRARLKRSSGSR